MKQEMTRWQWHLLDHMQIICTSLQADNHPSTSSLIFYRPDALPDAQVPNQQCQSTEGQSERKNDLNRGYMCNLLHAINCTRNHGFNLDRLKPNVAASDTGQIRALRAIGQF